MYTPQYNDSPELQYNAEKLDIETNTSSEYFLSISDLMSGLLLMISALLVVALINVNQLRKTMLKKQHKLQNLQDSIGKFVAQRKVIISKVQEIESRLRKSGLKIKIIPGTGEVIVQDQGVFFRSGRFHLEQKGKRFLRRFAKVYFAVVLSPDFRDHIKRISIVGHSSSEGKRRTNMLLSLRRAEAVAEYLQTIPLATKPQQSLKLRGLLKQKLLIAGRGSLEAHKKIDARDRTVRFRLTFRGDAFEIQKLFKKAGFKVKQ